MTTLASPSSGGSHDISLWRVVLSAGQAGPVHRIDGEQIWTVQTGSAAVTVDGTATTLRAGDTIVIPAEAERQIAAEGDVTFLVCGHPGSRAFAAGQPAEGVIPPWVL